MRAMQGKWTSTDESAEAVGPKNEDCAGRTRKRSVILFYYGSTKFDPQDF